MKPKVTVLCMAYNQEQFIRNTLDGFVMQKTNFPFEVLVHDDASTDKTPEIIREYAEKYPGIIIPILSTENHFRAGRNILIEEFYPRIRGKYVANCDGDDWWTDETKLQRQVDFLDTHSDFTICATGAKSLWWNTNKTTSVIPEKRFRYRKNGIGFNELLHVNPIVNSTVMYRWCFDPNDWPNGYIMPGDWFLHLLHAQKGKLMILPNVTTIHTIWNGGIWNSGNSAEFFVNNACLLINFYFSVYHKFKVYDSKSFGRVASQVLINCKKQNRTDIIQKLYEQFPELTLVLAEYADYLRKYNGDLNKVIRHRNRFISGLIIGFSVLLVLVILCL